MNKHTEKPEAICRSVFKNGSTSKERFTELWIELINRLEKSKAVCVSV